MSNSGTKPVRSPSYPNMALADAIAEVRKIEGQYRTSPVDREVAAKIIGYSGLSGPANKALAALAHYGLVERAGKGELRVTSRALAILHPNSQEEKNENMRMAAIEPNLFRELQERFPNMIPPEDGVETYLNRQGFNQTAIRPATKAYLQTLLFLKESGVSESHGVGGDDTPDSNQPEEDDLKTKFGGAQVGDLIQWEINGDLQMETPMRVRLVDEIDGRQFVAVEDSETGIPMEQVVVQERGTPPPIEAPTFKLKPRLEESEQNALAEGWKEERLIDDGGEEIFIRYKGEPTPERYTYIRDYLDFKLLRMKKS